ncbi:MAG: LL-diaminopimelate aminotransferase [Candidatus Saelkia tenebricola]|nr:LL-diaminopimelate aminotransferase [Candidatus Saelkia tenebricola]
MNVIFESSQKLGKLPPYLFVEIDRLKKKLLEAGEDIINLGIGDPDLATPQEIIDELNRTSRDAKNHCYPMDLGVKELRYGITKWFSNRFSVDLDPDCEVLPLIGSKEGIAHFPLAVVNPGDVVLIPEPLYPPYRSGAIFAGAEMIYLPLEEEHGFLPQVKSLDKDILKKTKILYLNFPNNPTTSVVDKEYLEDIVQMAREFNFIILYDAAYSEITFDGFKAPSILEIKGAKDVAIEFHSFSKTYNMTGWRLGWACGNRKLVEYLRQVKSNIDSGVFNPVQFAGIKALEMYPDHITQVREIYLNRRDVFLNALGKCGWEIDYPKSTFYIWAKLPKNVDSTKFCKMLLEECHLIATPGIGFGPSGEGYVRFSLVTTEERLLEAAKRISKIL